MAGIYGAMYSATSHMKVAQMGIGVIGANLARTNTATAKGERVTYQDVGGQFIRGAQAPTSTLGGTNPMTLGFGIALGSIDVDTTQGILNPTGIPTDLAVDGAGYFAFGTPDGGIFYSRDGNVKPDSNGDLIHAATGYKLLGWPANAAGNIDTTRAITSTSSISAPVGILGAAKQTSVANLSGNLSATAAIGDVVTKKFSVYNSLGTPVPIIVNFTGHTTALGGTPPAGAVSSWTWTATLDDSPTFTSIGSSAAGGNTPLFFDSTGNVVSVPVTALSKGLITVAAANGAAAFSFNLDFSDMGQLAGTSTINLTNQDGSAPTSLKSFSIGTNGVVSGTFASGLSRSLGQVSLANFSNPAGLEKQGSNMYSMSANSGEPLIGIATLGGRGAIKAGYQERSNIDVGDQFVDLIAHQHGMTANSKMVSSADQILSTIMNMKH